MLGAGAAAAAFRVEHFPSLGSTMDAAMHRAQAGDTGNLWLLADEQTAGRGRQGRTWVSEKGNLYASLLLIEPCPPSHAPQLGFVAGLALHEALTAIAGRQYEVRLKWPNDVLIDDAKISGILLEGAQISTARAQKKHAVVIGIGVNVSHHPDVAAYPTTSLKALGVAVSIPSLFSALTDAMASRLNQWRQGEHFAAIRTDWMKAAGGIGTAVEVRQDQTVLKGIFHEIDAQGRMVLMRDGKPQLVHAGDVYLKRNA